VNKLQLIPAAAADAAYIGARLRDSDLRELRAALGDDMSPTLVTVDAFERSTQCWVGLDVDAEPVTILGVAPITRGVRIGSPWLLATPEIARFNGSMIEPMKDCVRLMLEEYPILLNRVYTENDTSVRWLKRLGFSFGDVFPHGPRALPFQWFSMEAEHV